MKHKKTLRIDEVLGTGLALRGRCTAQDIYKLKKADFESVEAARIANRIIRMVHPAIPKPQRTVAVRCSDPLDYGTADDRLPSEIGIQSVPRECWRGLED
jgi:hypothetical protein